MDIPNKKLAALTIGALGVVFGDIGTSPLYAVKEVFNPSHGIPFSVESVLGGLSAIFWALMIIVSIKYVTLIMRADNKGEGGIMALLALASSSVKDRPSWGVPLALIGVFGAALFYGDGVITPAISVLSAIEGLEVATPVFKPYIVPLTLVVVIALFILQRKGTAAVGALFGPIMMLWFAVLGVIGVVNIVQAPRVLEALNPAHALRFLTAHGIASFIVLGSVFLAVTGAEALYADMGHFGKRSIRFAWFAVVFPGLLLNYFGQGALLMIDPKAVENPFYLMFPGWALFPMVVLSTIATVIASQAVISGAYSMTKQAIHLGFLPRTRIVQTSAKEIGQIYIPSVNWILLVGIIVAVIGFGSSTNLASAYGLAVSGTMLITTVLTFFVVRFRWHFSLPLVLVSTAFFLLIDIAFFSANLVKLVEGGWFPLAMGVTIFTIMSTWKRGREILLENTSQGSMPLKLFIESISSHPPVKVEGTGIFLTTNPEGVPNALLHNLKHNKVLHERVVVLSLVVEDIPYVPKEDYVWIEDLGHGFWRIIGHYGFKETPDVPGLLSDCRLQKLDFSLMETSFFVNRETIISTPGSGMATWREHVFIWMSHLAAKATDYFQIPSNRVIELGSQVEI